YIHPLHYQGKYFQVAGAINIPTPKYGRPRLFQAGTSIPGRDLAVRHVDAIFSIAWNLQDGQQFRQDIHQRAMEENRQPPLVLP
ncbi:LLM class flavin-dependent oxidoreductase, partial [Staphylococcus epidermidis]